MEKLGNRNELDQLYTDLCDSVRKMGKATSFCQLIKSATSDLDRIVILNKDCNIIPSLIKSIKKCRKNNYKDAQQARTILKAYYAKKTERSESISESDESLIQMLNSALSHLRADDDKFIVDKFDRIGSDGIESLENLLVACNDSDDSSENLLLSEIYRERSGCFYDLGEYKMTIIESSRAMRYAKFNKNDPPEHLFLLLFRISTSLWHLNQLQAATNVLQFSIKLLRSSHLDNAVKSVETMKMVKLLKNIQIGTKIEVGNEDIPSLDLKSCLEPITESLPEIFGSVSNSLSSTSSSLQMKWQEDRGRHLIAKERIPPGSTLIVEHPFSWIVHPSQSHTHCQNCCREVKNLIPCNECSTAVFCSEHCHRASQAYHQYECDFMNMLTTSETLGDMALLCYRTISKNDVSLLLSHIREYFQFADDSFCNDSPQSGQSFHDKFVLGLNDQSQLDSTDYCSVFAQTANTNARQGGDLLKRSFSAILLTLCLRLTGFFKNDEEIDSERLLNETEELFASLFLRHLQSTSCNAYCINQASCDDPRRLQVNEIGGATYPIISTTNHSCASNVYRFSIGKICIVKALREIQCGEEILDSYGPHFASNSIEERDRLLKGQYLFTCSCSACSGNWLLYSQLPRENPCLTCTACGNELHTKKKDKYVCSECANVLDAKKFMKTVTECVQNYQSAKELLLNANRDLQINYDNIEGSIVAYAKILEVTQKWPCQVLIECQETLKLCWNLRNSI